MKILLVYFRHLVTHCCLHLEKYCERVNLIEQLQQAVRGEIARRTAAEASLGTALGALEEARLKIAHLARQNSDCLASLDALAGHRDRAIVQQELLATRGEEAGDAPDPTHGDEKVSDVVAEECWHIVGIFFEGRNNWHLSRDGVRISVPIHDRNWLEQTRHRERIFGAGDKLRVLMRTVTFRSRTDGQPYAKRIVESVIAVIPPDQQLTLGPAAEETPAAQPEVVDFEGVLS